MLRLTMIAALLAAMNPSLLLSQDVTVVLDFTAQQVVSGPPVRAGEVVNVRVVNFNSQCFSPTLKVEPESAPFDATAATRMFATARQPEREILPIQPGEVDIRPPLDQPMSVPIGPGLAAGDHDRALTRAELALEVLEPGRSSAETILSQFEGIDCAATWDVSHLLRIWDAGRDRLLRWGVESVTTLERTSEELRTVESAGNPEQQADAKRYLNRANAMINVARRLAAAQGHMDALRSGSEIVGSAVTEPDHQALRITVTGTGDSTNVVREYRIPLKRRHRFVFSTGLVATGAPSIHYDRVNRVAAPGDTVAHYSTFARQSGNGSDLVNPALMLSASLLPLWSSVDLYATAGTTLRTVNGDTSLEPLLGIGAGIIDRLFFHTGVHFGRAEDLLLRAKGESAEDVASREIPTVITRAGAVGVRWKPWYFAGFGLRVN